VILNFDRASTIKEIQTMTSYALAVGIPLSMATGAPASTIIDFACTVLIPVHAHVGMRSVLIDYLPHFFGQKTASSQALAMYALGAITIATTFALAKFNLTDIGLSRTVQELWTKRSKRE
jgi:succinate dehydrogenase hydrophobic anchor subunit